MSTSLRRFLIVAPPSATGWLTEVLNRAFGRPTDPSTTLDRLIERLTRR